MRVIRYVLAPLLSGLPPPASVSASHLEKAEGLHRQTMQHDDCISPNPEHLEMLQ